MSSQLPTQVVRQKKETGLIVDPLLRDFLVKVFRRCLLIFNAWIEEACNVPEEKRVTQIGKLR